MVFSLVSVVVVLLASVLYFSPVSDSQYSLYSAAEAGFVPEESVQDVTGYASGFSLRGRADDPCGRASDCASEICAIERNAPAGVCGCNIDAECGANRYCDKETSKCTGRSLAQNTAPTKLPPPKKSSSPPGASVDATLSLHLPTAAKPFVNPGSAGKGGSGLGDVAGLKTVIADLYKRIANLEQRVAVLEGKTGTKPADTPVLVKNPIIGQPTS